MRLVNVVGPLVTTANVGMNKRDENSHTCMYVHMNEDSSTSFIIGQVGLPYAIQSTSLFLSSI